MSRDDSAASAGTTLDETANRVVGGDHSPEQLRRLAGLLEIRLNSASASKLAEIEDHLGRSAHALLRPIIAAADPAERRAAAAQLAAQGCSCGDAPPEPTAEQEDEAAELLARRAATPVAHLLKMGML